VTRRELIAAATLGVLFSPDRVDAQQILPGGGAAGGDALMVPNGDIIGVRNIQGGTLADPPESLNLDIGAGSTEHPGDLVLNFDVGRDTLIYDGHKRLLARFGPAGIRFYRRPSWPRLWRW